MPEGTAEVIRGGGSNSSAGQGARGKAVNFSLGITHSILFWIQGSSWTKMEKVKIWLKHLFPFLLGPLLSLLSDMGSDVFALIEYYIEALGEMDGGQSKRNSTYSLCKVNYGPDVQSTNYQQVACDPDSPGYSIKCFPMVKCCSLTNLFF